MPWKSNTIFEARSEFVQLALAPNANIQSLCRSFNISRQTGYRTLARYRIAGARGLESQSHRPHHTPHRCPGPTEAAVLTVRADHPTWGGRKIAFHLLSVGCAGVPAASTITAILARHDQMKGTPDPDRFLGLLGQLHNPLSEQDLPNSLERHPDLTTLIEKLGNGPPL